MLLILECPDGFCGPPLHFTCMLVQRSGIIHKAVSNFINLSYYLVYSKWTFISSELTFHINIVYWRDKCVSWFHANQQRECHNTISRFTVIKLVCIGHRATQITESIILSFGWFPCVWILCVDVSEHSVCSIFKGGSSCLHHLWRWNRQTVPKSRYIKSRRGRDHPNERTQHSEHGVSSKSKIRVTFTFVKISTSESIANQTDVIETM